MNWKTIFSNWICYRYAIWIDTSYRVSVSGFFLQYPVWLSVQSLGMLIDWVTIGSTVTFHHICLKRRAVNEASELPFVSVDNSPANESFRLLTKEPSHWRTVLLCANCSTRLTTWMHQQLPLCSVAFQPCHRHHLISKLLINLTPWRHSIPLPRAASRNCHNYVILCHRRCSISPILSEIFVSFFQHLLTG